MENLQHSNPVFNESDEAQAQTQAAQAAKRIKVEEATNDTNIAEVLVKYCIDPFKTLLLDAEVSTEDKKKAFYHLMKAKVIKEQKGKKKSWTKIKEITDAQYLKFVYDEYHKGIE